MGPKPVHCNFRAYIIFTSIIVKKVIIKNLELLLEVVALSMKMLMMTTRDQYFALNLFLSTQNEYNYDYEQCIRYY